MEKACRFFIIASSCLFLISCSSRLPNSNYPNSNSYSYPHSQNWGSEHMGLVAGSTVSVAEDNKKCSTCHKVMKKNQTLATTCAVKCHSPTDSSEPKPLPKPIANECDSCHPSYTDPTHAKYSHYPSGVGLCKICHVAQPSHLNGTDKKAVTTQTTAESCYRCHNRKDTKPKVHGILEMDDESCKFCHNPHSGDKRYFINAESTAALCTVCHDIDLENKKSVHLVTKTGKDCINCHTPHSGELDKLLIAETTPLCLSCHDKEILTADGSRTIPNIREKVEGSPFTHSAISFGDCTSCHFPHSSENNRLLVEEYSIENFNKYKKETYALCFLCHDDQMMKKEISGSETNFRNDVEKNKKIDSKNLHWYHVVDATDYQDKSLGRSCKICHDPHGSTQKFNINTSWKMKEEEIKIVFSPKENGGECTLACHSLNPRGYSRLN